MIPGAAMTPTRPRTRPGIAAAGGVLATATAATAGWAQRSPASTPIVVSPLAMACETNALGLDALKRATNRQNLKARNEVEAKLQAAADTAAPDSADRVLDFARC